MKLPNFSLNDLFRSPPAQPVFAAARAGGDASSRVEHDPRHEHLLFARGTDDDGYGDYDDDPPYEEPAQSTRRAPGAQRGSGGAGGSGGGNGGRQRSVQFQPEERYWTEYLRIALPIVGLLLMIGLFWYWASQLTDDDNGGEPIATDTPGVAELITPDSTPAPTQQVVAPPTSAPAEQPASTPEPEAPANGEAPAEEPVDEPVEEEPAAETATFAEGDAVIVNDSGVNLRSGPTTAEDNIVTTLDADEVLTITGGPEEAEEYIWWEVIVESTSEVGFVVEEYLSPAE